MVVELSEVFTHGPCNIANKKPSNDELQNVILNWMKTQGINANELNLDNDGKIKVNEGPNLKLHSLILKAEELGLEMKFTKKTLIEFC